MASFPIDIHLFVQALVYFAASFASLLVAVLLALTQVSNFVVKAAVNMVNAKRTPSLAEWADPVVGWLVILTRLSSLVIFCQSTQATVG